VCSVPKHGIPTMELQRMCDVVFTWNIYTLFTNTLDILLNSVVKSQVSDVFVKDIVIPLSLCTRFYFEIYVIRNCNQIICSSWSLAKWVWNGVHSASWVQLRRNLIEKYRLLSRKAENTAVGIRHANHVAPFIRKSWQSLLRQAAVAWSV
jgi:hypothetical protein